MGEPFGPEGLPLELARERILEQLQPLGLVEQLPLAACLGRITAEPVLAAAAVPGFRASIMDGYAIAGSEQPLAPAGHFGRRCPLWRGFGSG